MGEKIESHPDAKSRREMLEKMHRRAGQQLPLKNAVNKVPQRDEQQAPLDSTNSEGTIH